MALPMAPAPPSVASPPRADGAPTPSASPEPICRGRHPWRVRGMVRVPWAPTGDAHGTRSNLRPVEPLLPGKVALITGAGSGQGRAAAVLFAGHGARIGAVDINGEGADETVRLVKDTGAD